MIGSVFISLPASCVPVVEVAASTSGEVASTSVFWTTLPTESCMSTLGVSFDCSRMPDRSTDENPGCVTVSL